MDEYNEYENLYNEFGLGASLDDNAIDGQNNYFDAGEESSAAIQTQEERFSAHFSEQFDKLHELEEKVKSAIDKAKQARESADKAAKESNGFFNRGEAIEALQAAVRDMSSAISDGAEAQKISFEYQKRLSEFSKFLLVLGAKSVADNRMIVKEIQLRLKGASEAEISEYAKQELISVVKQLQAQEDLQSKQEKLTEIVKKQETEIQEIKKTTEFLSSVEGIVLFIAAVLVIYAIIF